MTNLNDLQQIREFVQIAESGSISAAAKILSMGQPTLSRHLAALETQIGAPLIRRDTHTMSLTEAGRILLVVDVEAAQHAGVDAALRGHGATPMDSAAS